MTKKDFRFIGKKELINLLIKANDDNEKLEDELKKAKAEIEKYKLAAEAKHGSMLEARVDIGNLFANAQIAADHYVELSKQLASEKAEACKKALEDTLQQCEALKNDTKVHCEQILDSFMRNFGGEVRDENVDEFFELISDDEGN